jgi:hypothetical protein
MSSMRLIFGKLWLTIHRQLFSPLFIQQVHVRFAVFESITGDFMAFNPHLHMPARQSHASNLMKWGTSRGADASGSC